MQPQLLGHRDDGHPTRPHPLHRLAPCTPRGTPAVVVPRPSLAPLQVRRPISKRPPSWGKITTGGPFASDEPWAAVGPLLPEEPAKPRGGRSRCGDRAALEGIVFVLRSGIARAMPPRERFGCTGMTGRRRLRNRHDAGVPGRLCRVLPERLAEADRLNRSRASIYGASVPAKGGGCRRARRSARTPRTAAGRAAQAPPPRLRLRLRHAARLRGSSGANRHDEPDVRRRARCGPGRAPRPRAPPASAAQAPRGQGPRPPPPPRPGCRARSITPRIARRGVERSDRLGRHRRVVGRTPAWLARFRRLTIRDARRADIHRALTSLACSLIRLNRIRRFCWGLLQWPAVRAVQPTDAAIADVEIRLGRDRR